MNIPYETSEAAIAIERWMRTNGITELHGIALRVQATKEKDAQAPRLTHCKDCQAWQEYDASEFATYGRCRRKSKGDRGWPETLEMDWCFDGIPKTPCDGVEVLEEDPEYGVERHLEWAPRGYRVLHGYELVEAGDLVAVLQWRGPIDAGSELIGLPPGPGAMACRKMQPNAKTPCAKTELCE